MSGPNLSKSTWQSALVNAITDPQELLAALKLDPNLLPAAQAASNVFPLMVPRNFINRIEPNNPDDPLLRQFLPLGAELETVPGYEKDPLQEAKVNPVPGLLHKYHGRVLLTFVGTCAISCRYCFRREFPYQDNNPGKMGWDDALTYIADDTTIDEVILSGGDPLVANEKTLKSFTDKLNEIPHVKRLRIHSRIPIVLPERITDEFIGWIKELKQKVILVIHCNHPREISPAVKEALLKLKNAGVVLLSQAVLLKGVNDDLETLVSLSEALFDAHVQPYYLHVLDKVQGAAHFDLPRERAHELYDGLLKRLSGYLIPKLVCEQPGAASKLLVKSWEFCTD